MRARTACNKLLAIPAPTWPGWCWTPAGSWWSCAAEVPAAALPVRLVTRAVYDRTTRRWRHLDLGAARLLLEAEIRRLACRACGRVRTETVPWARPGARFTHDFEAVVVSLAQRTDKTTITRLLRCCFQAVAAITVRVVAAHLDDARLDDCTASALTRSPTARATAT